MGRTMIGDVQIFMQTALDMARQNKRHRPPRNHDSVGRDFAIGHVNPRGIMMHRAAVQQFPVLAVGLDRPGADQARVKQI